ncbi:MAG: hypothetical protein KDD33_00115 [Bdellovibrionales bacterium]|nr:hypothetical protein [Bdellovibrionales bacterium]
MKSMILSLLVVFALFGIGCDSLDSTFGCSKKNDQPIDLQLGEPGKTDVQNEIPENKEVEVLGAQERIEFVGEDGTAWIHHDDGRKFNDGDIVVGNEDQKYLLKIKKVNERYQKKSKVLLRQSRIADLVDGKDARLQLTSTPVYSMDDMNDLNRKALEHKSDGQTVYETDEKGKITIRNLELFSIDINNDGNFSKGVNKILGIPVKDPYDRFEVSGAAGGKYRAVVNEATIEIIPTIRNEAEWSWGRIKKMNARLDTRVKYKMDVTYEAAGHIKLELLMKKFMPKKIIPVRVPGTPPVYLDIELAMPAGASLKSEMAGTSRVIFEAEYEFYSYVNYDENGLSHNKDYRTTVNSKKISVNESTMKVDAEIFLKPMVTARFYRVVGAAGYVRPYLRGEIEIPEVYKKDDLFIGANGGVALELSEPIFLSNVVSYSPDEYEIFKTSFDLDGKGSDPLTPQKVDPQLQKSVTVNQIGPEGFVVFDLKEKRDQFMRYELVSGTAKGVMVPSETFFMDGKLYYWPLPGSTEESFKVRITSKDGSSEEVEILVKPTDEVLKEVSQDRFGTTTNSYLVSTEAPGQFENRVPHHQLGGQGIMAVETEFPPELEFCMHEMNQVPGMSRSILQIATHLGWSCPRLLDHYTRFMERNHGSNKEEDVRRPKSMIQNIQFNPKEASFEVRDSESFLGYILERTPNELHCRPRITISRLQSKTHFGFVLDVVDCGLDQYWVSGFQYVDASTKAPFESKKEMNEKGSHGLSRITFQRSKEEVRDSEQLMIDLTRGRASWINISLAAEPSYESDSFRDGNEESNVRVYFSIDENLEPQIEKVIDLSSDFPYSENRPVLRNKDKKN